MNPRQRLVYEALIAFGYSLTDSSAGALTMTDRKARPMHVVSVDRDATVQERMPGGTWRNVSYE